MKKLVLLCLAFSLVTVSAWADDSDSDSSCKTDPMQKLAGLQCISCGIQAYYQNKTKDLDNPPQIVPSEKWLAFLAATEVQTGWLKIDRSKKFKQSDNAIVTNDEADFIYKKDIIAKIQAYGFCTSYVSRQTIRATGGKPGRDLDAGDWTNYVLPATTHNLSLNEKQLQEMGTFFGFRNAFLGSKADTNMKYLVNGDDPDRAIFDNATFIQRREDFLVRLQKTLDSGVASPPKDNGLMVCLQQMQNNLTGTGKDPLLAKFSSSNNEGVVFCRSMADSCNIDAGFCYPFKVAPSKANGKTVSVPLSPPPPMMQKSGDQ